MKVKVPPLALNAANLVEYHPNWEGRKFFVDQSHWHKVRPWAEEMRSRLGSSYFNFDVTGHAVERRDGVRFGSDSEAMDAAIASRFVIPIFDDSSLFVPDEEPEQPKLEDMQKNTTGRGRPRKAASLGAYPLARLRRLGDSMLVKISPTSESSLRRFISDANTRGPRKYNTHKSSRGMLVVLTEGPVPDPVEVFEEDMS